MQAPEVVADTDGNYLVLDRSDIMYLLTLALGTYMASCVNF